MTANTVAHQVGVKMGQGVEISESYAGTYPPCSPKGVGLQLPFDLQDSR